MSFNSCKFTDRSLIPLDLHVLCKLFARERRGTQGWRGEAVVGAGAGVGGGGWVWGGIGGGGAVGGGGEVEGGESPVWSR